MIERCQLGEVEDRILGHLSKGYRQRVGLAEAMVHDPDILILDEPTAGLDPIQIREVRALIRELGDRHTILLSTHIMPEVEAVCGRVIIIAQGRIALDDRLDQLQAESADRPRGARARRRDPRGPGDGPGGRAGEPDRAATATSSAFEVQTTRRRRPPRGAGQPARPDTAGRSASST